MTEPRVDGPRRTRAVICVAISTLAFAVALALRDSLDPWRSTVAAAGVGIALSAWALGPRLRALFAVSWRGVLVSVALGVCLVAATHAGFALVRLVLPELARSVRGLYGSIDNGIPRGAIAAMTAIIVVAEELVWRGVAMALVPGRARAAVASVVLYVLPQLPGHVPVLIIAAAVLGTILAVQRLITGRLVEPILTHAIWSVAIFVVLPVT